MIMSEAIRRRDVFRAGAAALSAASYSRVLGANDRIHLGVVGCGGRSGLVTGLFQAHADVAVTAVCDVWGDRAEAAAAKAPGAKTTGDHRALLEMKPLDAVLVATPDHWHTAIAIDAMQAGKDVYCEKPLTLRISEGPPVVKAARTHNRVCQVGMQQRSGPHYQRLRDEWIRPGKLGKITLVRTWWHGNSTHLRKAPASLQVKPANLDWARYLGPVKWRDWDPQQYANFRAYLDFGGGQVTDLFTHWIDAVHMIMGQEVPISAVAAGGVYSYKDGRTAPDTINLVLEYPGEWNVTFEATLVPGMSGAAIEFCGTEGRALITRKQFEIYPVKSEKPAVVVKAEREITMDHVDNFLAMMRSRGVPNGDVLVGHRSAQASHLGNISYVEKRRIKFDPVREEILPL